MDRPILLFYYYCLSAPALTPAAAIISSGLLHVERHLALTLVVTSQATTIGVAEA